MYSTSLLVHTVCLCAGLGVYFGASMEYNIFCASALGVNTSVEWSGDELFVFLYFRCSHKDFKPELWKYSENRWGC